MLEDYYRHQLSPEKVKEWADMYEGDFYASSGADLIEENESIRRTVQKLLGLDGTNKDAVQ